MQTLKNNLLKEETPFQRIINYYFKESEVYFDGNLWKIIDSEEQNEVLFLNNINKIYKKSIIDEISKENALEEAAALYRLITLCKSSKETILLHERIRHLINSPPLFPKHHNSLFKQRAHKDHVIFKIFVKLIIDYQTPVVDIFTTFHLPESLKLKIFKIYLVNPFDESILKTFWKIEPNKNHAVFILDPSRFKEAVDLLTDAPYKLNELSILHLKNYFYKQLWFKDFAESSSEEMIIKLKNYHLNDGQILAQAISRALFLTKQKTELFEIIKNNKRLLLPWKNWMIHLIQLINAPKSQSPYSLNELCLNNNKLCFSLKNLILESFGEKSSLLELLDSPSSSNDQFSKEEEYIKEHKILCLSYVTFAFSAYSISPLHIKNFLPNLKELLLHPDQEQKKIAAYYCIFLNILNTNVFKELRKKKIPLVPAVFCTHYILKSEGSKNLIEQILKKFFNAKHCQDRISQRIFCEWILKFDNIRGRGSTSRQLILEILSKAENRKLLVNSLQAIHTLWNLELFEYINNCKSSQELVTHAYKFVPNTFKLQMSSELNIKFMEMLKVFPRANVLLSYYSQLQSWNNENKQKALELFRKFLVSITGGTFKKDRYALANPIMDRLRQKKNSVYLKWIEGESFNAKDLIDYDKSLRNPSVILNDIINKKSWLNEGGFFFDKFPSLFNYLQDPNAKIDPIILSLDNNIKEISIFSLEKKEAIKRKNLKKAEKVILEALKTHECTIKECICILKRIYKFLKAGEEEDKANDIYHAIKILSPYRYGDIIIQDTDDPHILFHCGRVRESCQNIYSLPELSCALLGYLWNSNNRILAIMDPETEEFMARAIYRMMKDKKGKFVIVLEKIHYNCSREHEKFYGLLLTKAAIKRAESLGLPLLTIAKDHNYWGSEVYVKGLPCPFDYSDAAVGNAFPSYDGALRIHQTRVECIYEP